MKGLSQRVVVVIITALFLLIMMSLSVGKANQLMNLYRAENAKTTGERIESAVHATAALENGMLELNLKGATGYSIYEEEGKKYVEYNYNTFSDRKELELRDVNFGLRTDKDETHDRICIINRESLYIEGGECR
jgi:hypothetical protein